VKAFWRASMMCNSIQEKDEPTAIRAGAVHEAEHRDRDAEICGEIDSSKSATSEDWLATLKTPDSANPCRLLGLHGHDSVARFGLQGSNVDFVR
jgi:hypothetical protein